MFDFSSSFLKRKGISPKIVINRKIIMPDISNVPISYTYIYILYNL